MKRTPEKAVRQRLRPPASARSRYGLDAVNFFLAELFGIGSPYLSDLLRNGGWSYQAIGAAAAMPAVGVCLVQPVAGFFLDRSRRPRQVLAGAAVLVGIRYVLLPSLVRGPHLGVFAALFVSGTAQALFAPLLAGLALGLVGHGHLHRTAGANQAFNHIGDVAAALLALVLIRGGVAHVYYLVGAIALLAAASALVIRSDEIDHERASGGTEKRLPFRAMLRTPCVLVLVASVGLFQAAYASAFPFVVLRVRALGGSNAMVAAMVLVTQATMTPVAIVSARLLERLGRKPVLAFGFVVLPIYVLACALARSVPVLLALQAFGSIGPGILGVAIIVVCADMSRGTGRYHALTAATQTAMAAGSVAGPLVTGVLVERAGYRVAFVVLALVASAAASLFLRWMPETRPAVTGAHVAP